MSYVMNNKWKLMLDCFNKIMQFAYTLVFLEKAPEILNVLSRGSRSIQSPAKTSSESTSNA